ncbi:MAG TPA: GTPase, partial [Pirellulaceae bacterium]
MGESRQFSDTIAAIASGTGFGWRGILRISGPGTLAVVRANFLADNGRDLSHSNAPTVTHGQLRGRLGAMDLPSALYLWPGRRSYTREPLAEFHTIGARPLLEVVLRRFCECGARLAEPGEFTLRAFLHGRIDLTQAEATLAVVDAQHQRALAVGLEQLAGGLMLPLSRIRHDLLDLLADLAAALDFVEEDLEFVPRGVVETRLHDARASVIQLNDRLRDRSAPDGPPQVVFWGRPNVGKSSLINAMAGRQVALVDGTPGTTRDPVITEVRFEGSALLLEDTAGITHGPLELLDQAAQRRSFARLERADVGVLCMDATQPLSSLERGWLASRPAAARLIVATKSDLTHEAPDFAADVICSART